MSFFKRFAVASLAALFLAQAALAVPPRLGFTGGSQAGFFPVGHWIVSPISSTVTPIFPLADSVTGATAREHQAYWDGTNDVEYDVAMGDEFGAYPYVCTLVQGPPGMTVAQSTYTTFQNANYCRVTWHPQGNISSAWNGEVEVAVTDQQHNTIDMSWALWTVGQYSTSSFSAAYSVNGSSTLTISGTCTGTLTPGTVLTGTDIPTGTYVAFDLTGSGCAGTYALSTAATGTTSGTVTGAYAGGAVFVSTTGSGTSCTYGTPCTFTQAFGSTLAATSYPGALAYVFGGTYSNFTGTGTVTSSSTTLTVNTVTGAGSVQPGMLILGTDIPAGTTVVQQLTGTTGLTGTYQMSAAATASIGPESITGPPGGNLPAFSDNSGYFEAYNTRKPNALIGIPSQSVTLDGAGSAHLMYAINAPGADWFVENITANGYDATAVDQLVIAGANRITFDKFNWTNSGYGNGTSGNMSMFSSTGVEVPRQDLFVTDSTESNRQSGSVGNNYGFADIYSYNNALFQRDTENSPSATLDGCFYFKSDITNSEMRENYADTAGANHCFDYGQSQDSGIGNNETDYNLGINILALWGGGNNFTWQSTAFARNTILSGAGAGVNIGNGTTYNLEGPSNGTAGSGRVSATSVVGGSLVAGTQYTWAVTSLGVTGESASLTGSNGDTVSGHVAGQSNEVTMTLAAGDGSAGLSWLAEPGVTVGYMGYRELTSCGGGAGCWTQYSLGNVTSWTDTGAAGTSANPPSTPGNAISAARFSYLSDAWQTTNATPPPPSGGTVNASGDIIDTGTASALLCLNLTTTGCNGVGQQVGDLNTTYSGTYGTYATIAGTAGYKIQ